MTRCDPLTGRRQFLKMLATSPFLKYAGLPPLLAGGSGATVLRALEEDDGIIGSLEEAIEVMDFEPVAKKMLLHEHWAFLATGVDDDATLGWNHEAFSNYQLRMRRLVDFSSVDMSTELFGVRWKTPIGLCPVGSLKTFHTQGEIGAAKAARAKENMMMLSTAASTGVEEVNEAYGEPVWYQLYTRPDWEGTYKLIKRVERAGCPVLVYTIDLLAGRNTPTLERALGLEGKDAAFCANCHAGLTKPMRAGLPPRKPGTRREPQTWEYVDRLKDATSMPLVLKGIVTHEDAVLAVEHGADGVIVSNHGGRGSESLRSTIECLPEVAAAIAGRIPILLDGGIRRGTDVFKALAMGADGVGIGRPYAWGLAGYGQDGVEKVIDILHRELELVMKQAGATSIAEMRRGRYVMDRRTGERL